MKTDTPLFTPQGTPERTVVLVPLGGSQASAQVYQEDLDRLTQAGVQGAWFLDDNGFGTKYVKTRNQGKNRRVARLILGEPLNAVVRYRNGDHTDLRRDNLLLIHRQELQETNKAKGNRKND